MPTGIMVGFRDCISGEIHKDINTKLSI